MATVGFTWNPMTTHRTDAESLGHWDSLSSAENSAELRLTFLRTADRLVRSRKGDFIGS
jgi:hypothetical protein